MKISTKYIREVDSDDDCDKRIVVNLLTDEGRLRYSIGEGEPEDMTLSRDLSDAYAVPEMLRAAFEAGKRGEEYEEVEDLEGEV